jgi:hypothetical protein
VSAPHLRHLNARADTARIPAALHPCPSRLISFHLLAFLTLKCPFDSHLPFTVFAWASANDPQQQVRCCLGFAMLLVASLRTLCPQPLLVEQQ